MSDNKRTDGGHKKGTQLPLDANYIKSEIGRPTIEKTGLNHLLLAAAPILSLSTRLRQKAPNFPLATLQTQLIQQFQHFMQTGQSHQYPAPVLLASRYFLSATLDELIEHSHWHKDQSWAKYRLLTHFDQDPGDSGRFFLIIQRCCENPPEYIDLIELGYHCLSMGFAGKYRDKPRGQQILAKLMDKLYEFVTQVRGEPSMTLSVGNAPVTHSLQKKLSWKIKGRWAGTIWAAVVIAFILILLPYKHKLTAAEQPILSQIQNLVKMSQPSNQGS